MPLCQGDDPPGGRLWGYAVWRMSYAFRPREKGTFKSPVKDRSMRGVTLFTTSVALAVPAILWPPRPVRAAELAQPVVQMVPVDAAAIR